jgi:hypothetical protein
MFFVCVCVHLSVSFASVFYVSLLMKYAKIKMYAVHRFNYVMKR